MHLRDPGWRRVPEPRPSFRPRRGANRLREQCLRRKRLLQGPQVLQLWQQRRQHVCEDPAMRYGSDVDTIECPPDGCTDETCCVEPDLALRYAPDGGNSDGSSGPLGLTTLEFVMCIIAIVLLVLLILLVCYCMCCKSGSKSDPQSDEEFDSEQEESGKGHGAAAVHDKEDKQRLDERI